VRVVGLTGGIGSGKSAFAAALAQLGVPVIDADAVARRCVAPGSDGLAGIVTRFGADVLAPDGTLDRAALAAIVFTDERARADLEAITHPCIRAGIEDALTEFRARQDPPAIAIVEHPLLVESHGSVNVDVVVVVEAPMDQRVARLTQRRGMSEQDVRARIDAQTDDATRRAAADHIVVNDGDLDALHAAAVRLLPILAAANGNMG
jgi:dephospho-CoA kinase